MSFILKLLLKILISGVRAYLLLFIILVLAKAVSTLFYNAAGQPEEEELEEGEERPEPITWTSTKAKIFYIAWLVLTLYYLIF